MLDQHLITAKHTLTSISVNVLSFVSSCEVVFPSIRTRTHRVCVSIRVAALRLACVCPSGSVG